jgi:hypothetical protein
MDDILRVVKDYDMVLCSGHVSPLEIKALADRCIGLGITKIVITHPMSLFVCEEFLTFDDMVYARSEPVSPSSIALRRYRQRASGVTPRSLLKPFVLRGRRTAY